MAVAATRRAGRGIGLIALLLALPLVVVLTAPLHTAAPHWAHVLEHQLWDQLGETLALLGITLALSLLFAVPSAWLVATREFPGRRILGWALVLPLAMPTYIAAFLYAALLGPTGVLSRWLGEHLGWRPDIMDLPGLGLVLALVLYPYIYLPARAAFRMGMGLELDAARTLGARGLRRFGRVALPLARPAIAAGALLVAMETLNDYGAVKYYGIRTLTTGIFRSWSGLYDLGSALRLSLVLLALVGVLLGLERLTRRDVRQGTAQVAATRAPLTGPWRWLAPLLLVLLWTLAAGLPLGRMLADVTSTTVTVSWKELLPAIGHTGQVAVVAAVFTLGVALLFAYRQRYGNPNDPAIRLAALGYTVPGAVIAIGVMTLAGIPDRAGWLPFALIGSLPLLTYAFALRFLAVGLGPLEGGLRLQRPELDQAARTLGARPFRAFLRVNLPLLRPALLAAATLVAIDVIKELPLTLILRPFNFDTLSTKAYELARIEQLREASWPALLIVAAGLLPVLLLERMAGRK
ncbi:MAG: iron ABC transporter permease [Flavobacteriales bacterium]|nr:iron ABC transporter permease [Flavobacteriales bacterium]